MSLIRGSNGFARLGRRPRRWGLAAGLAGTALATAVAATALFAAGSQDAEYPLGTGAAAWWISPGDDRVLPARADYENKSGSIGYLNVNGEQATAGHPFFEPIGTNGRACVTCHQPADGMSLAVETVRARWEETEGRDPLFAAVDGKNCPHLPQGEEASHSLLLERGLIRVFLPWPPVDQAGNAVEPEFDLEVVRDPTGCNTHPEYGLDSSNPTISVYRRPRPAGNLRYVAADRFGVAPFTKNGAPTLRNPETGQPVNMNMMADAREPTLHSQAVSALMTHMEAAEIPSQDVIDRIVEFELGVYTAQSMHLQAGRLDEPGGPPALGPEALAKGRDSTLGNNITNQVFPMGDTWKELEPDGDEHTEFRRSVARGHDVFFFRTFWIRDAMHLNSVGLGNPVKRTCSTCHGMHMTGMDSANGWMDVGTTNLPWAREPERSPWAEPVPELPLFRVTCRDPRLAHPFLGDVIYTQDPGHALISGKCDDVGSIVMQQFRGLASRAPYFSNGSASSIRELVDYYDRRFNMWLSDQEREDLVNFLSVL